MSSEDYHDTDFEDDFDDELDDLDEDQILNPKLSAKLVNL